MLMKVLRSELHGYNHLRSQFESEESRRVMNGKLIIFTVVFAVMAIENTFRICDFIFGWSYPIPPERPKELDFSSEYDVSWSSTKRAKYTSRKLNGPQAIAQTQICMWLMIVNNCVWIRRRQFSTVSHTCHYFIAALLLVLYIPRHDWFPVMQGPKFGYTNMNIFVF